MAVTLSNEPKNAAVSITAEAKGPTGSQITWDEAIWTWDEAEGTWDIPGLSIAKEDKNSLTITNESKN